MPRNDIPLSIEYLLKTMLEYELVNITPNMALPQEQKPHVEKYLKDRIAEMTQHLK